METKSKTSFFASRAVRLTLIAGAVLAVGVGISVADWSRNGPHGGQGQGWHGMGWRGGHSKMERNQRLCERDPLRYESVLRAYLKADLDLKPEQNAELDKLAAVLVPALKDVRDEVCNNFVGQANAKAPERLERVGSILRKAADAADKSLAPAKAFYAGLDDKQKARVDDLADRRHSRHNPGMMRP